MSTNKNLEFSPESLALCHRLMERYPEGKHKSAVIPILHIAQAEFDGWLSVPAMDCVAEVLKIQPIEVYEVASFYSMFNLRPVGKCVIEVCRTSSCCFFLPSVRCLWTSASLFLKTHSSWSARSVLYASQAPEHPLKKISANHPTPPSGKGRGHAPNQSASILWRFWI